MDTIRSIIFDIDGTLVDSNDAHAHAWVAALAEYGHDVPFGRVRRAIGMGGDKLLPTVAGIEKDSPQGKAISERRGAIFTQQYLPRLHAFPQVAALLRRLHADGFKLAIASSAKKEELDALMKLTGAAELFETATSSSDAEHSKPDPDIVQAALDRLDVQAAQALMIGDTPYDVEAAGRAGLGIIALRCGGWDDSALKGAIAVYASPADLLERYGETPLGQAQK